MKNIFYLFAFFFVFQSTAQESLDRLLTTFNTRSIPYISVEELRRIQIHDTVLILDSREKVEYNVSRIHGARYIGYSEFSSEMVSEQIKKNAPIVVYCSLGIRSEEIGEKLKKAGFTNIRNLYGGIFEWKNKGYPVIDENEKETEKIHAFSKLWGNWLKKGEKVY